MDLDTEAPLIPIDIDISGFTVGEFFVWMFHNRYRYVVKCTTALEVIKCHDC